MNPGQAAACAVTNLLVWELVGIVDLSTGVPLQQLLLIGNLGHGQDTFLAWGPGET